MTDTHAINWEEVVEDGCPECGGTYRIGSKWILNDCRVDIMDCRDCDFELRTQFEPALKELRREQAEAYLTTSDI